MAYIDITNIVQELAVFIKNSDIFTITQRGVTTTADTGTFAGDSSYLIDKTNVKNIRSIVVAAVTLELKDDYTADYYYDDAGTKKCKITFIAAQTGAYTITYDYGNSDKIYPDFPRPDLTLGSFPRVGMGIIGIDSGDVGFGNAMSSDITIQINVYDDGVQDIDGYLDAIRIAIIDARDDFKYLRRLVPVGTGPLIKSAFGSDKIMQKSLDVISILNYEIN